MSRIYDNWERLVEATLKRDLLRQLALQSSRESSFNSTSTQSDYSVDFDNYNELEAASKESPGIEGFQILGSAKPGSKLLSCGFPLHGTTQVMFQWIRFDTSGSMQYIQGATYPEYVVTADDVGKFLAVECIPMDEQGRQGDLLRLFANEHKKIICEAFLLSNLNSLIQGEIGLIMGVHKDMKKLSSTLTTIQAVIQDAEEKQLEDKAIKNWLCKLNNLTYKIDAILDECATEVSKVKHKNSKFTRYSFGKILYRIKIGRRVKEVTKELAYVGAERARFHLLET